MADKQARKTQAQHDAESIASRMAFCRHYPRGGMGLNKKCEFGIAFDSITPEKGEYPCYGGIALRHLCSKADHYTEAESRVWAEESRRELEAYLAGIRNRVCPHCGRDFTFRQVGRCVYAEPCGHRLYQGTVPTEATS